MKRWTKSRKLVKNEKRIDQVSKYELARDTKPGYNYNKLDERGLIEENTLMDDKNGGHW